ncbi:PREDICTED: cyclin-T2 isoform X2 [Nicrophorus vespilloides]|uniref:Cyclin-T2 isoform X2 n=1 Tax=Nicrophorus vespilloides TaxID=110193 RepID=A0ABM1MBM7_NICVS|nr:PREDICTED: cyclin-T2 isoform X2 [Nicrophorus vespilloides]
MATEEKWYFTKEHLNNSPSRQCGIDAYKELYYRQQAANFIQDMGQRLRVSQLCINTATVYMHRFYVFHSFTQFPWHSMAAAAIFLSAKVEEQPRKLEHVIRVHNLCKNPREAQFDVTSERYQQQSQDLVFNENVLLQTLGFDVAIDHPHAHVVRCCHLVKACKDLAQTSYFMASTSLHVTTMCLQFKPTVVACFCIHLACKWSNWEIPLSNEKKEWFSYVDSTVTAELLQLLTDEFLVIFERCPSRLKEKIMAFGEGNSMSRNNHASPLDAERKLHAAADGKDPHHRNHHDKSGAEDPYKHRSRPHEGSSSSQQQREREYREKKDRERMAHSSGKLPGPSNSLSSSGQLSASTSSSSTSGSATKVTGVPYSASSHHRPSSVDPKLKPHSRHPQSMTHMRPEAAAVRDPTRINNSETNLDMKKEKDMLVRSSENVDKRAYSMKPVTDMNNSQSSSEIANYSSDKRQDSSRSRQSSSSDIKLHQPPSRRHEDAKSVHLKPEDPKKQMASGWYDNKAMYDNKNNIHMKQPMTNSTSQKTKSPFAPDNTSKSVPKSSSNKSEPHNGNSNGGYGMHLLDDTLKDESPQYQAPPLAKKPSMFSPEKTPPRKTQPPNSSNKRLSDTIHLPAPISPLDSSSSKRSRTASSSSSDPEQKLAIKKIEQQAEGFENILRESTIKESNNVDDGHSIQPYTILKEMKAPDLLAPFSSSSSVPLSQPIVNGIETNPTLISNLLKEAPTVPHLPAITNTIAAAVSEEQSATAVVPEVVKDKEHHHKDRKKKNKEKHKHKDKSKDEKEKKKKHKDKHRNKDKIEETVQPIKITLSKIQPPEASSMHTSNSIAPPPKTGGLKITISKDRIKSDMIGELSQGNKISKDITKGPHGEGLVPSKKRERDHSSPIDTPPVKKSNYNKPHHGDKQNGRSSYNKVSNYSNNSRSHFNNNVSNNTFGNGPPPPAMSQNFYYNYPPPNMAQPPPHAMHTMGMPPPFLTYDPNVYYSQYAMYSHGMYPANQHLVPASAPPPLPDDAPPDHRPPPPPE